MPVWGSGGDPALFFKRITMKLFYILVKTPKMRRGFYYKKCVVLTENQEKALELAYKQLRLTSTDQIEIKVLEPNSLYAIAC